MNYVMRWNNYTAREKPFEKDVEFHTYIAKCSKNRVVETLVPIINTAVMTFGNLTHRKLMEETIETHRAVTDAIQKGRFYRRALRDDHASDVQPPDADEDDGGTGSAGNTGRQKDRGSAEYGVKHQTNTLWKFLDWV